MINHHNAPKFGYAGYEYRPVIEHEDEEGVRKVTHFVYLNCDDEPAFVIDASPYTWLTLGEFQYHIDMKQGGVEKLTEDQVLHKFPELYGGFSIRWWKITSNSCRWCRLRNYRRNTCKNTSNV